MKFNDIVQWWNGDTFTLYRNTICLCVCKMCTIYNWTHPHFYLILLSIRTASTESYGLQKYWHTHIETDWETLPIVWSVKFDSRLLSERVCWASSQSVDAGRDSIETILEIPLTYFGFPSYDGVGLCVSFSIRRCWNSELTQTLWTAPDNASMEWCHSIRRVNVMILMIYLDTIIFHVLFDFYGSCQTGVPLSPYLIRFLVKCQSNWLLRRVEWGWDQIENI